MSPPIDCRALFQKLVPVLFHRSPLLAVAKPAGVDTGALSSAAGSKSAPTGLVDWLNDLGSDSMRPVNRLSRYESGVLLLCSDRELAAGLRKSLRANRMEQEYLAVVVGRMPKPRLEVEAVHGASRGQSLRPAAARGSRRPAHPDLSSTGRRSRLHFLRGTESFSLIRCWTTVETTHALRAQLRAVELRLLGDRLHDRSHDKTDAASTRLHLSRLRLPRLPGVAAGSISAPPPAGFPAVLSGQLDVDRPLHAALTRRLPLLARADTNAFRLVTGDVEDLPGLVAECLGEVVILQVSEEDRALKEALRRIARWYQHMLGVRAVYVKWFLRDRQSASPAVLHSMQTPEPLLGEAVPPEFAIHEGKVRYLVRPYDGFSAGLFLDQRDNRRRVHESGAERDVLNLFAYTCGFSVAAAVGGAKSTVSVDLSPRNLDWGRRNLAANGVDTAAHRLVRSDALGYLKRAERTGESFDLIVIDPPSFAHGRRAKQSFSVVRDLPALLAAAAVVLRSGGMMLVSTNYRRMTPGALRAAVRQGTAGRRLEIIDTPPLPVDFALDPDHAKSILFRLD